jgi:hypothetical protein
MVGRRRVLGLGLTAVFGFLVGTTEPSRAQTIELKVSHYLPPNHTIHKFVEAWAAQLAERSGGRLVVKSFRHRSLVRYSGNSTSSALARPILPAALSARRRAATSSPSWRTYRFYNHSARTRARVDRYSCLISAALADRHFIFAVA